MFQTWIKQYYDDVRLRRTNEQVIAERSLCYGLISFRRWMIQSAGVLIHMSLGSLFAWSVLNEPIALHMGAGVTEDAVSLTYFITIASMGIISSITGPWIERHGPLRASLLGCVVYYIGNLLAALACYLKQMLLLYVAFGVFVGIGMSLAVPAPVTTTQKWFPEKRGYAAGVVLAGFGIGSVIASFTQTALVTAVGCPLMFLLLGSVCFLIQLPCAMVMRFPPPGYTGPASLLTQNSNAIVEPEMKRTKPAVDSTILDTPAAHVADSLSRAKLNDNSAEEFILLEEAQTTVAIKSNSSLPDLNSVLSYELMPLTSVLKTPAFALVSVTFTFTIVSGLLFMSKLSDIIKNTFTQSSNTATLITSVNGLFNALGRLIFGIFSDRIGRLNCFLIALVIQLFALAGMMVGIHYQLLGLFCIGVFLLTGMYGAGFSVIPGLLGDLFGDSKIGLLYGFMYTLWAFSAVAGGISFTNIIQQQKMYYGNYSLLVYDVNFYWIITAVVIGLIAAITLKFRARPLPLRRGN